MKQLTCIPLLVVVLPALILFSHAREQRKVNDTYGQDLDTLEAYPIRTESGLLRLTRPQLADMPADATGLLELIFGSLCARAGNTGGAGDDAKGPFGCIQNGKLCCRVQDSHQISEASFTMSITMTSPPSRLNSTSTDGLCVIIFPVWGVGLDHELNLMRAWEGRAGFNATNPSVKEELMLGADGSLQQLSVAATHGGSIHGGGNVSVEFGWLRDWSCQADPHVVNVTFTHLPSANYTLWIDYDRFANSLSVYIGAREGNPKPDTAIAVEEHVNFSNIAYSFASIGILSSVGQLAMLHNWEYTIEGLPLYGDTGEPSKLKVIVSSSVAASVAATVAVATAVACYYKSKQRRWKKEQHELVLAMQRLPGVPTQVDFADIKMTTNNFHETMKLGRGGFGAVYRCTLPASASRTGQEEMEVAVKKFTRDIQGGRFDDFLAEVSIINRLRHRNIVPLVGWSYSKGVPLLVYEYMANGSLDQHLFRKGGTGQHQQGDTSILKWQTRYNIARDIATGLHYVHHEHEPVVLHRDIKANNIMLDDNFRARLGDFGIACTVAANRNSATGFVGTIGYIAPEYQGSNRATRQTDIYAFGLVILEVVTGKKHEDVPPDDGHLTYWVWRLHHEDKLLEAVDSKLTPESVVSDEARGLLLLGLACTNPIPLNRPSMVEVLQVINKSAQMPELPVDRPMFVWPPEERYSSRNSGDSTSASTGETRSASVVELGQVISLGQ